MTLVLISTYATTSPNKRYARGYLTMKATTLDNTWMAKMVKVRVRSCMGPVSLYHVLSDTSNSD